MLEIELASFGATHEDFGLKPVFSIWHSVVYEPAAERPADLVILERRLYASHYFQSTSNRVTWAEGDLAGVGSANYLVYYQRARFDDTVGGIQRGQLNRKMANAMEDMLEFRRDRLEELNEQRMADEDGQN